MKALPHIIKKEFTQVRRTRSMIAITLFVPLIQLVVLGFAVSSDIEHVPAAIVDYDNTPLSRNITQKLVNSRYIDIDYRPPTIEDARSLIQKGDVVVAVIIPRNFAHDIKSGSLPQISANADAQNTTVAMTASGYIRRIILEWAQSLEPPMHMNAARAEMIQINTIETESRVWYNPELRQVNFMIPGIIVLLVSVITILLTSMAIVRERELGTLEQLMVSPITKAELILGKTIPFAIIGLVELTLALILAWVIYGITISGSLALFYGLGVVYLFSTLGLGILVSTISSTQQQALFGSFFVLMFAILMSGFFLPLDNMPTIMYLTTFINPVRYFMTVLRELFIKGTGIKELWPQLMGMATIALVVIVVAVSRFQKKLG